MIIGSNSNSRRAGILLAALLISVSLSATALMGQMFLGSIVGLVSDTSGAVVPDAKVVLTNTQTGVQRTSATNTTGNYTFDSLPTGTYTVSVTKTGFREAVSSAIPLGTQVTVRFDTVLEIGKGEYEVKGEDGAR